MAANAIFFYFEILQKSGIIQIFRKRQSKFRHSPLKLVMFQKQKIVTHFRSPNIDDIINLVPLLHIQLQEICCLFKRSYLSTLNIWEYRWLDVITSNLLSYPQFYTLSLTKHCSNFYMKTAWNKDYKSLATLEGFQVSWSQYLFLGAQRYSTKRPSHFLSLKTLVP